MKRRSISIFELLIVFNMLIAGAMTKDWKLEEDLPVRIKEVADRLSSAKVPDDLEGVSDEIQNLNYLISQSILKTKAKDMATPSDERREVIEKIAEIISLYNRILVKASFSEGVVPERVMLQCRSLLDYTMPDVVLQETVWTIISEANSFNLEPYRVLFEHRLLDEKMRALVVAGIKEESIVEKRRNMALASAEMGFDIGIEACRELLSVPFSVHGIDGDTGVPGENEILLGYRKSLSAILFMGPKARDLLPLLIRRRDEIVFTLGMDESKLYVSAFEAAILCVQGRRPVTPVFAKNGSGLLSH